jgi:prepilin-type N-terminal cleavage/methylation domain-containing protein
MERVQGNRLRAARARSGFSMLELMIAVVLLAIGVLSAFYGQVSALNLLRSMRERNTAMSDLEACMERILAEPLDAIPTAFPGDTPIEDYADLHLIGQQLTPSYPGFAGVGDVPEPLEILLTASWNDWRGRPQTIRLASVRTR